MKHLPTLLILLFTALHWGCVLSDVGCTDDADCREGRLCQAGACVGEVAIVDDDRSTNNGAPNSTANNQTDVDAGNNVANNITPNSENNETVVRCEQNDDCPEAQVCAPREDGTLGCSDSWSCQMSGTVAEEGCITIWECGDRGAYSIECVFGDQDRGACICIDDGDILKEFDTDRDICEDREELAETAVQQCGWLVPQF